MTDDPYRRVSGWYDRVFEPINAGLRGLGMKMHRPETGMRVLDIGCGTGAHLDLYRQAGCAVSGIDPSPSMLALARRRLGEDADLRSGSADSLPYADGEFDLIVAMLVLHEMFPDLRAALLGEAQRTMKPDGRILLIDFQPGKIKGFKGVQSKITITLAERLIGGDHYRNYRQFMASGGLPGLLDGRGLAVDKNRVVAGGTFGLYVLKAGEGRQ